jgi:hypothetical protein
MFIRGFPSLRSTDLEPLGPLNAPNALASPSSPTRPSDYGFSFSWPPTLSCMHTAARSERTVAHELTTEFPNQRPCGELVEVAGELPLSGLRAQAQPRPSTIAPVALVLVRFAGPPAVSGAGHAFVLARACDECSYSAGEFETCAYTLCARWTVKNWR